MADEAVLMDEAPSSFLDAKTNIRYTLIPDGRGVPISEERFMQPTPIPRMYIYRATSHSTADQDVKGMASTYVYIRESSMYHAVSGDRIDNSISLRPSGSFSANFLPVRTPTALAPKIEGKMALPSLSETTAAATVTHRPNFHFKVQGTKHRKKGSSASHLFGNVCHRMIGHVPNLPETVRTHISNITSNLKSLQEAPPQFLWGIVYGFLMHMSEDNIALLRNLPLPSPTDETELMAELLFKLRNPLSASGSAAAATDASSASSSSASAIPVSSGSMPATQTKMAD